MINQHCALTLYWDSAQGLKSQKDYRVMCPLKVKGGAHRWTMKHREGWPASASCLGSNRRLQSPVAAAGSVSTRPQAYCKAPISLGRLQIRLWISTKFSQTDWMEFERWEIRALPRTGQKQMAWFPSQQRPALEKVQYLHQGWTRQAHRSTFMPWQKLEYHCRPSCRCVTILSFC